MLVNVFYSVIQVIVQTLCLALVLAFSFPSSASAAKFVLDEEEAEYIKTHGSVTLCRINVSEGIDRAVKVADIITRDTGLNLKLTRRLSWDEALQWLYDEKCDLLTNISPSAERMKKLNFTPPYAHFKQSIVTTILTETVGDMSAHLMESFAILKNDYLITMLRNEYPNIKLIEVDYPIDGVRLVEQGLAYGYIGSQYIQQYMLENHSLNNLMVNNSLGMRFDDIHAIATRKEDKILNQILSKAVDFSDRNEIDNVIYLAKNPESKKAFLTAEEKLMFDSRTIIICYSDSAVNWNTVFMNFAGEFNVKVENSKLMSLDEAFEGLIEGLCDVLPQATETKERRETMSFTPSFHQEERVIVTIDQRFITNIEDHLDEVFVIRKGDLLQSQLMLEYPEIQLKFSDKIIDGLKSVQAEEVFGYVGNITDVGNTINRYSLKNVKIAGTLPDRFNDNWAIATRVDDLLLNSALTKYLETADKRELRKLFTNKFYVKSESGFDYRLFWQLTIVSLVIIIAVIVWNRRLAKLNLQLEAAKKMREEAQNTIIVQEKMAGLGTLTAGVAHEINNPTNFTHVAVFMMQEEIIIIKAFLIELAGGENADPNVIEAVNAKFEKLIELTETAKEGTQRIKTIVSDLRTFSRSGDTEKQKVVITDLITSTVHLVKTQYHDININVQNQSTQPPIVQGFAAKIGQVFMNTIVNACQAIEQKRAYVSTLAGEVTIIILSKNNMVEISISDNGCGMSESTQVKIFDPFFTTKEVGFGTGLGMAITFGIIQEHDGDIDIESTVEDGTTVKISLPTIL
ncbi:ATP-binding protein [Thalassotalea atypica]|uniref:ATP-binding protein n=1 Tax=Thalassotalea atypica TaxID=2054316 RepID=UPI002572216E|nr:transporter substrate-binding domain-containing protein [Thalassotalea atypica]